MEFKDLPKVLQEEIEAAVADDLYKLKPETLYNNIRFSTGTKMFLAKNFNVSYSLVTQIKMHNKEIE